jgi:hypothetical protein
MITEVERINLLVKIDEGIARATNELKQCVEDCDNLREELSDLRTFREVFTELGSMRLN